MINSFRCICYYCLARTITNMSVHRFFDTNKNCDILTILMYIYHHGNNAYRSCNHVIVVLYFKICPQDSKVNDTLWDNFETSSECPHVGVKNDIA